MAASSNRVKLANYLLGQQASTLGKNYVKNSFALQNTANVTSSGATTTRNTTTPLTAISDFSISLQNNATDTVTWSLDALDNSMSGKNCELRLDYTASSIGSNVVFRVLQGSSVVAQTSALTIASTARTLSLNVPCGDLSTATTVVLANGTGNSGTSSLKVANVTYGLATNLGNVSATTSWMAYTPTFGGFGTVSNVSFYSRRVGSNLEVSGRFTAGTVTASTASITIGYNGGNSNITIDSTILANTSVVGTWGTTSVGTGFNNIWPIATGGNNTINFGQQAAGTANLTSQNGSALFSNSQVIEIYVSVPISQFTDQTVFKPETTPASWSGYSSGWTGSAGVCSTSSSTFADVSACTGMTVSEITNRNFGTVSQLSGSLPGITFTPPKAGMYHVCATTGINGSNGSHTIRMVDGSGTVINAGATITVNTPIPSATICGIYNATSVTSTTFKLQLAAATGTIYFFVPAASGAAGISWEIIQLDTPMAMPYLTGSVTSQSSGGERIERAELNCDASSSITSQSGNWLSAIGNRSTTSCTITIASGVFSSTPACVFTVKATTPQATSVNMTSSTAGTVYAANADYDGYLICMGQR